MLFTTAAFFLLFLPITLIGFFAVAPRSQHWAAGWLFLASVFFYGYWMPQFTLLLLGSICWNFLAGVRIGRSSDRRAARLWLIVGISVDLALLAWFKYANFFVENLDLAFGAHVDIGHVVLPIGISFFTFTQIAFLADSYQRDLKEYRFIHYGLFVTYFPHLIAGPVLHHAQMMPQFRDDATYRPQVARFGAGMAIFAIGLTKKVLLADGVAPYADAVFRGASGGIRPDGTEAWLGALAYTVQLYFDFSGYSDMAIGLSWLFNVRLPFNFNSPYKSLDISDFWRRWHMSLSTFLRDYLYISLGGNRRGPVRRYINLFVTMLLGGLWHGANWTFVFWGGLHGIYLAVNHGYRALIGNRFEALRTLLVYRALAWGLTMLCVVVAWVFFRAPDFASADRILEAMMLQGGAGGSLPHALLWNDGLDPTRGVAWCAVLGAVALLAPNSNLVGERIRTACERNSPLGALLLGSALLIAALVVLINETRSAVSAFIYFNF